MPSLISQMLNGQTQTTTQQPQQNNQLNRSIENTRKIMYQFQNSKNPEQMLTQLLAANPQFAQIASAAAKGNGLQQVAQQMADAQGISLADLIHRLVQK